MQSDPYHSSSETGKKVWESFMGQLAEGQGFLRAMFQSFKAFCKRNILFLLIFGIIGGGIAAVWWFMQPKVYEAEMTVSYVHYEKKIYADMLAKLNGLIASGNVEALAGILDMPEESVSQIHSITSYSIRREPLVEDFTTEKLPFYIVVGVSNLDILEPLQDALINYLNGTDFIQDRLTFMKQKNEKELVFLKQRLDIADSLSRLMVLVSEPTSDEKTVTRMELLGETIAIYSRIQEAEGLLEFNVNIEVLDGFVASKNPLGKGLRTFILYGFLAGIVFRFLVLAFR